MKCPKCRDGLKQTGKPDTDEFGLSSLTFARRAKEFGWTKENSAD